MRRFPNGFEFKSNVVRYTEIKGYIFELQSEFDNLMYTAIWIHNPQYGIKMHCISAELTEEEIQNYLKREADELIDLYKNKYED